jgi:hypothetical protein
MMPPAELLGPLSKLKCPSPPPPSTAIIEAAARVEGESSERVDKAQDKTHDKEKFAFSRL